MIFFYYIGVNCIIAAVIIGRGEYDKPTPFPFILPSIVFGLVVPGRTARMIAELNMSLLNLKQIFVRYESHQIR
jgi:hypothetical protein